MRAAQARGAGGEAAVAMSEAGGAEEARGVSEEAGATARALQLPPSAPPRRAAPSEAHVRLA